MNTLLFCTASSSVSNFGDDWFAAFAAAGDRVRRYDTPSDPRALEVRSSHG